MADSQLYDKLTSTAKNFVLGLSPKTAGTNEPDPDRLLSYAAPDLRISFGHKYFVSKSPGMQGHVAAEAFLTRMGKMAGGMQTWEIVVTDTCVDVGKKSAVLRADFNMTIPGHQPVNNDILWWLRMDDGGAKVVEACEYIDPVASEEIMNQMKATRS